METWLYTISAGVALVTASVALLWTHRKAWKRQQDNAEIDDAERHYLHAQYRRRMQASGWLTLLGLLIPIGDVLIPWVRFPAAFALYWGFAMLVACWVIVLGMLDVRATSAHSRVTFERLRREQRSLEQELAQVRSRESNGRDRPTDSR